MLIGIAVVILVILAVVILKRRRRKERTEYREDPADFDFQAAIGRAAVRAPKRVLTPSMPPVEKEATPSPGSAVSVIEGCSTITECLDALVRKFSLESFTLATCDGLVFASSGGGNGPADAAKYSEIFSNDPLSETPGVFLFGLDHSGSRLVGIIRTPREISRKIQDAIENDTKDILNRWI